MLPCNIFKSKTSLRLNTGDYYTDDEMFSSYIGDKYSNTNIRDMVNNLKKNTQKKENTQFL